MNDFDFDELDKAVHSLATKTREEHGSEEAASQPTEPVVPAERRSPIAPQTPATSEAPTAPATPIPVAAPQKRPPRLADVQPTSGVRRGIMDIMPPTPRRPVARTAATLQPVHKPEDVLPQAQADVSAHAIPPQPVSHPSDDLPMIVEQPHAPEPEAEPAPATAASEVQWPDPLDIHDAQARPTPANLPEAPVVSVPTPEVEASTSPFLPEAKVEKRPLGAYSSFVPEASAPTTSDELRPQPAGTFKEPSAPEVASVSSAEMPAEPEKPDLHTTAMMSIPQQYRAPDKATDTTPRPVYDTKEYHPPLAEKVVDAHRASGMWSKLFIAFVILVLLAVGGYLTFVYVTQR